MNQLNTIFNGAATLELPKGYTAWTVQDEMPQNTENEETKTSIISVLNAPLSSHNTVIVPDTAFISDDGEAYVCGVTSEEAWPTGQLEQLLQDKYQTLSKSLPLFDNVEIASRTPHIDKNGKLAPRLQIGLIRCTFSTPHNDWFLSIALLPIRGNIAELFMLAPAEHLVAHAMEFMTIADSLNANGEDIPKRLPRS